MRAQNAPTVPLILPARRRRGECFGGKSWKQSGRRRQPARPAASHLVRATAAVCANQSPQLFADLWKATLASGPIALALGVVVLVWPGPSILVAAVFFGLFLVLSGVIEMVFALTLDVSVGNRILLFISGALSVILGLLAFRHFGQGYAVLLLAIWIGVAFIFQGVSELTLAISHREIPGRGWLVLVASLPCWLVLSCLPGRSVRLSRWHSSPGSGSSSSGSHGSCMHFGRARQPMPSSEVSSG